MTQEPGGGNALVEYSENANGYYLRFIDGTQICGYRDLLPRYSGDSYIGVSLPYPATFTEVFSVVSGVYTAMQQGSICLVSTSMSNNTFSNTTANLILTSLNGNTLSSGNKSAGYISIGRWK